MPATPAQDAPRVSAPLGQLGVLPRRRGVLLLLPEVSAAVLAVDVRDGSRASRLHRGPGVVAPYASLLPAPSGGVLA